MPVLGATTLMTAKLNALDERACDLTKVIPAARAVREQVDWDDVAAAVARQRLRRGHPADLLARLRRHHWRG